MTKLNTDYATNLPWNAWKNGHNEWVVHLRQSGSAKDLTDYVFRLDIFRNSNTRGTPVLSLTEGSGLTNGGADGKVTSILTQTQSQTTLKGSDYYYVLSYVYDEKTFGLYKGHLTLASGQNPGSPTLETSAEVTMAGSEGSHTTVIANVTLGGEAADFDVDSITPEQAQTIMAKLIDNMTDEQKDEFVAAIIDDIRTTINDA